MKKSINKLLDKNIEMIQRTPKKDKALTHKQVCAKGGTNRWKGKSKKERKAEMVRIAKIRWSKASNPLSTVKL